MLRPLSSSLAAEQSPNRAWALFVRTGLTKERDLGDAMLQLLRRVGSPFLDRRGSPLVDRLVPRPSSLAPRRASLTALFGTGPFPLHTDTATWIEPARYVALAAARVTSEAAQTTIAAVPPTDCSTAGTIAAGIFVIANGRHSFLGSILQEGRRFVRFDRSCMRPVDRTSQVAMQTFAELISREPLTTIDWNVGDVVILDNWSVLHGRSSGSGERMLLRSYAGDT